MSMLVFGDLRKYLYKSLVLLILLFANISAVAESPSGGVILVVGDSLSAGYGLALEKSWVALLSNRLAELNSPFVIMNKSVSGETTQNGVESLPKWLEEVHPTYVILALGSNDGLRGTPVMLMQKNIEKMIDLSQQEGARVILVGFMIPPNYGPEYSKAFKKVFSALAEKHKLPFVPFLLEGIAGDRKFFQEDGLHPSEASQSVLLENVWKILEPLIKS